MAIENIPIKGFAYWKSEIEKVGLSDKLKFFNDVVTESRPPHPEAGYGDPALQDVTLEGIKCDIYHSDHAGGSWHRLFIHKKIEKPELEVEEIEKGNKYKLKINKDQELLKKLVTKVCEYFNEPPFLAKEVFTEVSSGGSYRFEGTYNLSLTDGGDVLYIDNRNAKGNKASEDNLVGLINFLQN